MRRTSRVRQAVLVCIASVGFSVVERQAQALPPLRMLNIRQIEADENNPYWLTDENGPWCILASSFAGEGAAAEAHKLVIELRRKHGLEAYMHKQRYDYNQNVQGLGVDKYGAPKRMRYLHGGAYDEIAVLVGNYNSVNDPNVDKTLEKIKYLKPASLNLEGRKQSTQRFAGLRAMHKRISGDSEKSRRGPMGNAFVTRNPLLPQQMFATKGVDRFVLDMNKEVPHSLLDCPGKFSVKVATFRGNVIIDQKQIEQIESGGGMKSRLDDAAVKAHTLTEALRKKGIEAYEFHDRFESIVTVGSFDAVGTPREDGRIEINPAVYRIMNEFSGNRTEILGGAAAPGLQPKKIAGVLLDVQPVPVEVPKRSIGADYARF
jgi:hypothetical protein